MSNTVKDEGAVLREGLFRRKAEKYLLCFCNQCPRHEHCLRWRVGLFANPAWRTITCINPCYEKATTDQCDDYRDDTPVMMARGMSAFFDEIPKRKADVIRAALEQELKHTYYYEYQNGSRLIPPEVQAKIERICRENGWTEAPQFDSYEEGYNW